jgi:hypothetical protein
MLMIDADCLGASGEKLRTEFAQKCRENKDSYSLLRFRPDATGYSRG